MAQLTIPQVLRLALEHHQAGRLPLAEELYRKILAHQPEHPEALHYLGIVAHQVGRNDVAVELITRALAAYPKWPEAYSNLATSYLAMGKGQEAVNACRKALDIQPLYPEGWNNLGSALKVMGEHAEAIKAFKQAIALKSGYAEAYYNLGISYAEKGAPADAVGEYRRAVEIKPEFAEAYNNLGIALGQLGLWEQAAGAAEQALKLRPEWAEGTLNLGLALHQLGRRDDALRAYRRAVELKGDFDRGWYLLGTALLQKGLLPEAAGALQQAVAIKPTYADAWISLGQAYKELGRADDAVEACRKGIALAPQMGEAHNDLGNALVARGEVIEAVKAYRAAVALRPQSAALHSNLVYTLHYMPGVTTQIIAEEHQRYDQQHAAPLKQHWRPHGNDRTVTRKLRVGYVSPDFREHVAGRFLLPMLKGHDRNQFDVVCYSNVAFPDAMTAEFARSVAGFKSIVALNDEQAAELIRADGIDILVDVAMHMAHNRALLFARKPAPVQVTTMAYPSSNGLSAMDYRLSDPYLDPPDREARFYAEKTIRLPETFWCYDPLNDRGITVGDLPALGNGYITFGCLNNFSKISEGVVRLWGQVLRAVDHARLMLLAPEGSARAWVQSVLAREGVDPSRVIFIPRQERRSYMETFNRIDISLDTFPYNGHTTSLESLWMGVPVVTLVGDMAVMRAGFSQLSNLGMAELAGQTTEEFVRIAVGLARDVDRLRSLREGLRARMEASVLMDMPRWMSHVDAAYRHVWNRWANTAPEQR